MAQAKTVKPRTAPKAPKAAKRTTRVLTTDNKVLQVPDATLAPTTSVQARIPKGAAGNATVEFTAKAHTPRVGHNAVAWQQLQADIKAGLTLAAMVQAANDRNDQYTANQGRYVGYTVRRGWCKFVTA